MTVTRTHLTDSDLADADTGCGLKLLSSMVILLVYKMYDELLCKQADSSVTAERMFVSCRCQTCCVVLAPDFDLTQDVSAKASETGLLNMHSW